MSAGGGEAAAAKIEDLKQRFPTAKVVTLGLADTVDEILGCIEAGASGYATRDSSFDQFVDTIRMVHRGEASLPPQIAAMLVNRVGSLKRELERVQWTGLRKLTSREAEVLHLLLDGLSNKEIAARLGVEPQAAKNHVHSILQKLGLPSRRAAIIESQRAGVPASPA